MGVITLLRLNQLAEVQSLMNRNPRINRFIPNEINDLMLARVQYSLFGFMSYIVVARTYALIMGHMN